MKIKTSELSGVALDWAVAHSVGMVVRWVDAGYFEAKPTIELDTWFRIGSSWSPSANSNDMAEINIGSLSAIRLGNSGFAACETGAPNSAGQGRRLITIKSEGPTMLIAACRAIVAAKLGDEVDVPEGLV